MARPDPPLPLPHERDETAPGGTGRAGGRSRRIGQAARDLAEGQVDTDLRATPGLDAERRRDLLRRAADGQPTRRPPAPDTGRPGRGR